jgi:hypothetical protein
VAFGVPTSEEGAARRLMTPGAGGICQMDNYLDARSRVRSGLAPENFTTSKILSETISSASSPS